MPSTCQMDAPHYRVPKRIELVLFDLDDTLSDYASTRDAAVREWIQRLPHWQLSADESVKRWEELEIHWFARYAAGELDLLGQRAQRVRDFLPWASQWSQDKAIEAFDQLRAIYEANWRAFPDAQPAVRSALASSRKVGILTNGGQDYQTQKMRALGLFDPQVRILASSELPAAKPDQRAFQAACASYSVRPQNALMIGDNPSTDIAGGIAAGLEVCHLCRGDGSPASPIWVRSLADIEF